MLICLPSTILTLLVRVRVAECDVGFTRGVWHIDAYNPHGIDDPLGTLGFPSYLQSNGFKGVPAVYLSTIRLFNGSDQHRDRILMATTVWARTQGNCRRTLDKVHGPHEFKVGFDGRLHQINYIQTNAPVGVFSFDENGSPLPRVRTTSRTCGGDAMASSYRNF